MHNQPNRRAAKAKGPRSTVPVPRITAFPSDVVLPPQRGATVRMIDQPLAPAALVSAAARLLAVPARPQSAKPASRKAAKRKMPKRKVTKTKVAVIALPHLAEPLVTSGWALVPYRPGGLIGQLNHWLSGRVVEVWKLLGGLRKPGPATQMRQLRAENAKLKAQLKALLALQNPPSSGARKGALLPLR